MILARSVRTDIRRTDWHAVTHTVATLSLKNRPFRWHAACFPRSDANAGLEEMTDAGDELVWKLVGSIGDAAGHKCSTITPYTIEAFVKKSDLGTYGARNFKLGAATQNCAP